MIHMVNYKFIIYLVIRGQYYYLALLYGQYYLIRVILSTRPIALHGYTVNTITL